MPTLVIDHVPAALYDWIQHLARTRSQTPADTVLNVLEAAYLTTKPLRATGPLPRDPFLTEEIGEPVSLPWPTGEAVRAERVSAPLPAVCDLPVEE